MFHRKFRDCLGYFSTGITIVTTFSDQEMPVGLTVNSFNSLSLEPALILFSLDKNSLSLPHFLESGVFTVNMLAEHQVDLSKKFSLHSPDKWRHITFTRGEYTNCPILPGILAYLECEKEAVHEGGDHWLFIGRVVNFDIVSEAKPLLYYKGLYHKIGEKI